MQYEGFTAICFECGRAGHRKENCPSRSMEIEETLQNPNNHTETEDEARKGKEVQEDKSGRGPWMLVP